ncbi:TPA: hypothetical protein IAA86_08570 [Candidatus Galligastranaerophilus intestinavium]|uniref:Tetratricopeptide repeat protein n=1 Tax=Candidatus Galligastranaerophilus intestinavium TaxID=2840836 RepID=A0A9D1FKV7_9BACT|nr:hypothetical protein [Candidatus Galligastranaerophilus intestinavium]
MRKIITLICLVMFGMLCIINYAMPADAARKSTKEKQEAPKVDEEQLKDMTQKIDLLTRKYYTRELYSPEDSDNLINLKLQLDEIMNTTPEPVYAPLYYKLGTLYKLRGMRAECIDCLKTVIENFSDTAYGPKAREVLTEMGVVIKEPEPAISEDEEYEDEEEFY